ncbi:MAG: hypothetical protein Q7T52_05810, partial [Nocardioides sp.]|nr:hypothetical protein [Nocardioides sp.]
SGKAPYAGGTDYQVVMAHVEQPVPQLAPTGPLAAEINRVLRTAMAKAPGDRYPSAQAMRDDLRAVVRLPDDATPARPADAAPQLAKPQHWTFAPPVTPTPTPTPTPSPLSTAPPAPPFRPPTPSTPQFASAPTGGYHQAGPAAPGGSSRAGWIIAAVLVLVLVVGSVVAVVLIAGDDDGGDTPADDDSSQTTDGGGDSREDQAVDALATRFAEDPTTDPELARCFAQEMVTSVGVDQLIESGLLNEDLEVVEGTEGSLEGGLALLGGFGSAIKNCAPGADSPTP